MSEPMEQLAQLLHNNAIHQPVLDFIMSLINKDFDQDRFAEETKIWLEELKNVQAEFSQKQDELQVLQKTQLDQLQEEQTIWSKKFNEMREQLVHLHAQNLKISQDYVEQMVEVHKSPNSLASQAIQRQRLAMIFAFLPLLPTAAAASELLINFGGIEINLPNPYLPPNDAAVRIALDQFDCLPTAEQGYIHELLKKLKTAYNLNLHPLYQARRKAYFNMAFRLISTLRRVLHERTEAECNTCRKS